jgi:hypothetical protein
MPEGTCAVHLVGGEPASSEEALLLNDLELEAATGYYGLRAPFPCHGVFRASDGL